MKNQFIVLLIGLTFLGLSITTTYHPAIAQTPPTIERVSVATGGAQGQAYSRYSAISATGRFVAFISQASLDSTSGDGSLRVFVHDRVEKTTKMIPPIGNFGSQRYDYEDGFPSISNDGRLIAFTSMRQTNWPGFYTSNVFVFNRLSKEIKSASSQSGSDEANDWAGTPSISGDGRFVFFNSDRSFTPIDWGNNRDLYVRNLGTKVTSLATIDSNDFALNDENIGTSCVSSNGQYLVFNSVLPLTVDDTDSLSDVFLRDVQTGDIDLISVNTDDYAVIFNRCVSDDGRYVAFTLYDADNQNPSDVFVHDRDANQSYLISANHNNVNQEGNGGSDYASISRDGKYVSFFSNASDLVPDDTNGFSDIFVREWQTSQTARVSLSASGLQGNNDSVYPSISANGNLITFTSFATNLVPNDTNFASDIFVAANPFYQPPPTVSISHVEVTQVIQDETNSIPLIAGKLTLVRVYVDCGTANCFEPDVTGVIRQATGGFPFPPMNGGITAYHEDWKSQRGNFARTLNFILPNIWLSGNQALNIEVEGTTTPLNLSFQQGQKLHVAWVGIPYQKNNKVYSPDPNVISQANRLANLIYPVGINGIEYYPQTTFDPQTLASPFKCNQLECPATDYWKELRRYWKLATESKGWVGNVTPDRLFGWLPPEAGGYGWCGFADGKLNGSESSGLVVAAIAAPGRNCSGWSTEETFPHELAHLLNDQEIKHAPGCGGLGPDSSYPNQTGKLETTVSGVDVQKLVLYDPAKTYDMMSYCKPVLISKYNYLKLITGFKSYSIQAMQVITQAASQREILVSGVVNNPSSPTVTFDPFYPFTSETLPDNSTGTDYCLEMRDQANAILDSRCFDLNFKVPESGETTNNDIFVVTLPYPLGTQSIVMSHLGQEIGRITVSSHTPIVQLVSPNGGQSWGGNGTYQVSWTASDADNDVLHYILYYSPDNGVSWMPVALDLTGTSVDVNAANLPGSTTALFKIVATDQMNTAEDVSDAPFTVGAKGPQVSISAPGNNATVELGAPVLLQGSAYDLEDGTLSDTALSWGSSLDGDLGTGETILPTLSLGQHLITLTATDSDGTSSAIAITITVQQSVPQPPSTPPPLLTPANNTPTNDNTPTFTWDIVARADAYRIEIDNNVNFSTPEDVMDVGGLAYEAVPLPDGLYYWRVRGLSTAGDGPWSTARTLTVDTAPPAAPTPVNPLDGSTVANLQPGFSWTKVNDAARYEIRLDTVNPPVATATASALTYSPPAPLIIATYYWQVRAVDLAGNPSDWSALRMVTIESPTNALPARNYFAISTPVLTWSSIAWATEYEIQVDNTPAFNTDLEFTTTVPADTFSVTTAALPDGTYYWRVRGHKADGSWGAWSAVESFMVDAP